MPPGFSAAHLSGNHGPKLNTRCIFALQSGAQGFSLGTVGISLPMTRIWGPDMSTASGEDPTAGSDILGGE